MYTKSLSEFTIGLMIHGVSEWAPDAARLPRESQMKTRRLRLNRRSSQSIRSAKRNSLKDRRRTKGENNNEMGGWQQWRGLGTSFPAQLCLDSSILSDMVDESRN